jgi:hypothetical protein
MNVDSVSFEDRIAPAEKIFFTWLPRVFGAATLVGCAWIDDAPPLVLVALFIAIWVAIRIVLQFNALRSAAPFNNGVLSAIFAVFVILLLAGTFPSVVIFVERLSLLVVG